MLTSTVSAGDTILATQYNNLRTDVKGLGYIQLEAGVGGVTAYDLVYLSALGIIKPADPAAIGTTIVIGMALETKVAGQQTWVQTTGFVTNAGWAWTYSADTRLYLSTTAGQITQNPNTIITANKFLVEIGYMINTTQILLRIGYPTKGF